MVEGFMNTPLRLSFTFGGLLFPETVAIAKRYQELPDWAALKAEADAGSLLRKTRGTTRDRYFREIRERLKSAWPFELELIARDGPGARYADFALCCRFYPLVGDFVREVLRDKAALKDERLDLSDYYHFLERKALVHPELLGISETTRTKLRSVTFRMLAEGMLMEKGKERRIKAPAIPKELAERYAERGDTRALEHLLAR
jgi:hypothetical protein